ncbi:hypothetical protein Tco_0828435 [Tanacetum coccineum]
MQENQTHHLLVVAVAAGHSGERSAETAAKAGGKQRLFKVPSKMILESGEYGFIFRGPLLVDVSMRYAFDIGDEN